MTAAQTVTAAVCCQTLRGEEGKKEQGYVIGILASQRHFTYPPSQICPHVKLAILVFLMSLWKLSYH